MKFTSMFQIFFMYYFYIHYFPGTFEEDGSFIGLYGSMGRKVRLSAEFNPPPPPGSATFVWKPAERSEQPMRSCGFLSKSINQSVQKETGGLGLNSERKETGGLGLHSWDN
jgi:hypothetical protein